MEITVDGNGRCKVAPEPTGFEHIECDAWVYVDGARAPVVLGHNSWKRLAYPFVVETIKLPQMPSD